MRERLSSFDMVKHEREVWEMRNEDTADMWFYIIRGTFGAIQMSAFFNPHSIQIEEQASLL